jgi:integrase
MGQTKQAKTITSQTITAMMGYLQTTRQPLRNQLVFLLSVKGGLRAIEISNLTWSMVMDAEGNLTDEFVITNHASKGKTGGRVVPIARQLKDILVEYHAFTTRKEPHQRIVQTERSDKPSARVIVNMFSRWYQAVGLEGCSSHSGRRTFITNGAKKITAVGGSLRDIQYLSGHSSLQTTQRYIDGDSEARRKVVDII